MLVILQEESALRYFWAVLAFIFAAVFFAAGISQRTIFAPDRAEVVELPVDPTATYLVIDGAVLNKLPGTQTIKSQDNGMLFQSYARSSDVLAWLSDANFQYITLTDSGEISSSNRRPLAGVEIPEVPRDPQGHDIWIEEYDQKDMIAVPMQLPEQMSVLIATDGKSPVPGKVSISWPINTTTPWSGPLIVLGILSLIVGFVLYFLALQQQRRSKGPRRKHTPVPDLDSGAAKPSSGSQLNRVKTKRSKPLILAALSVSSLLVLSGCTADAWPQFGGVPSPTATADEGEAEQVQTAVVTQSQAERIIIEVSDDVRLADASQDEALAKQRLSGSALAARLTNYRLMKGIDDYESLPIIPTRPLNILLPQASDEWPRSIMAVVEQERDEVVTATIMVLVQATPWSNYKLDSIGSLSAATEMPDLPAAWVGGTQLPPETNFLALPPAQLAAAYADLIQKGDKSDYAALFNDDSLRESIAADRAERLKQFKETGAETGQLSFSTTAGDADPVALATLNGGAIVAVSIIEKDVVKPTDDKAVIRVGDNKEVKVLSGVDESDTGFETSFIDQLFFYVPAQASSEKIRLLGYGSSILNAKEL